MYLYIIYTYIKYEHACICLLIYMYTCRFIYQYMSAYPEVFSKTCVDKKRMVGVVSGQVAHWWFWSPVAIQLFII